MKLYENVVIGNFLFALGFHTHRVAPASGTLPVMINLLQQTPEDKNLGDVLLQLPGTVRLLEFKARSGRKRKERQRQAQLATALSGDNQHLEAVSRAIHWYLESDIKPGSGSPSLAKCLFVAYLDAFNKAKAAHTSLEDIASAMADEGADPAAAIEPSLVGNYLSLVRLTVGNGETGAGGIVINCSANGLAFAELTDVADLKLSHRAWIQKCEIERGRALSMVHEHDQQKQEQKQQQIAIPSQEAGR
ncbi:MAG: hypothetical protein LBV10_16285 [Stenotrophomonas sp.]|jgi:hypothetical protein|nr:hypothetical protein [Stenotrophomonas sp.]MDR2961090.1 hypothetical protein [Stenotrophomonas sp.]